MTNEYTRYRSYVKKEDRKEVGLLGQVMMKEDHLIKNKESLRLLGVPITDCVHFSSEESKPRDWARILFVFDIDYEFKLGIWNDVQCEIILLPDDTILISNTLLLQKDKDSSVTFISLLVTTLEEMTVNGYSVHQFN